MWGLGCIRFYAWQDIGWFDEHPSGELPGAIINATEKIQNGIGRKVMECIMCSNVYQGADVIMFELVIFRIDVDVNLMDL